MSRTIRISIEGRKFEASLNSNQTVDDLLKMLPLELTLQRYAGHEYFGKLPQKPSVKGVEMTSYAHAAGIYYYDGWAAFTVLYGDADITPYKVVHLGDLDDEVILFLKNSDALVAAKVEVVD
ncbi:cyclophilin-like fold protein [uncultured Acetobacteroides sp.]|uniref:cyclophilin-like fold protein n=1 Tax=uncultured Acetobacteroides sp. TaxID=1760811 RepID=UPI0029F4C083|nr:cyclophilin-like fold protein [uncultured Acetobacteroides sp.]